MELIKTNRVVPTGNICIMQGEKGDLEFLSIGDYGKEKNIKADFLGFTDEINGVENADIMPLEKKWVITLSTQYGCSMNCTFCDVPLVGKGVNATLNDLENQFLQALSLHPEVTHTERLNVHYARMGEPTFNYSVLNNASVLPELARRHLDDVVVHPVVSTMMPRNNRDLLEFLHLWTGLKNIYYNGDAGLQLSINSTDDNQRLIMFNGNACTLDEISEVGNLLVHPIGRKYTLNFAISDESVIDAELLETLFDPNKFMCKVTPIHDTMTASNNGLEFGQGYIEYMPYKKVEEELKAVGFDVLVFIPSPDEDDTKITCGNAILAERTLEKLDRG